MKKVLVMYALLLSIVTASFSFGQATMYVSSDNSFACADPMILQYMMLLFMQEDLVALDKTIKVAMSKGDLVPLKKGEKVFYLSGHNKISALVWIRRQGDPVPLLSFYDFFK